jgi:hypothetical protein
MMTTRNLHNRWFRVVETTEESVVSHDTVFAFRQEATTVEASYSGGRVIRGYLIGLRTDDRIQIGYVQIHDGRVYTGTSELVVEDAANGALRLRENYIWADGREGCNVLEVFEHTPGG